jgi:hypothetical protein
MIMIMMNELPDALLWLLLGARVGHVKKEIGESLEQR